MWGLLGGAAAVAIALFTWYNGGSEAVGGLADAVEGMSRHASSTWRFGEAWNDDPWTDDERRAQILRDGDGHQMVRAVGGVARVTMAAKSLAGSPSVPNAPAGLGFSDGQTISEIGVWAHGTLAGDASAATPPADRATQRTAPRAPRTTAPASAPAPRTSRPAAPEDDASRSRPRTRMDDICYGFDPRRSPPRPGPAEHRRSRTHLASLIYNEDGTFDIWASARLEVRDPASGEHRLGQFLSRTSNRRTRTATALGLHRSPLRRQRLDGRLEKHLVTGSIRDGATTRSGSTSRTRWSGVEP